MINELEQNAIYQRLKKRFNERNRTKLLILLGILGILLICLPEFFQKEDNSSNIEVMQMQTSHTYAATLSGQLETVLGKIEGVGEISVLVTLSQEEEYLYALDHTIYDQQQDQNLHRQSEQTHVIVEKNGQEEPLVSSKLYPKVQGVIIVCEGGGNPVIIQKLTQAVTSVLNISSNHVTVSKLG